MESFIISSMNPAYRIYNVFAIAITIPIAEGNRQLIATEGWMRVFNLKDQIDVLKSLWSINVVYNELASTTDEISDPYIKGLYKETVDKIRDIISIERIVHPWANIVNGIIPLMIGLQHIALGMHSNWKEKEIEKEKLEEWRKELLEIEAQIATSDIESSVKLVFQKQIKKTIESIDMYILWGNEGIQEAINNLGVSIASFEKTKKHPSIDKMKTVVVNIWNTLQVVSCLLQISGFSAKDVFLPN